MVIYMGGSNKLFADLKIKNYDFKLSLENFIIEQL